MEDKNINYNLIRMLKIYMDRQLLTEKTVRLLMKVYNVDKPKVNPLEVRNHLALIEGQKETKQKEKGDDEDENS